MKFLILIPLVFVAACASHPQVAVRPLAPPAVEPIENVRYDEVVRAYHVGRYVDPSYPETMHERHPVYRVETSARWNLHPGGTGTINLLNPPPDAAFSPPLTDDALVAEMNRQREATARVMREATRLAESYGTLHGILSEMKGVIQNGELLQRRFATNESRIEELERTLESFAAESRSATNEVPSFAPEPEVSFEH